jgi:hypothetical protein
MKAYTLNYKHSPFISGFFSYHNGKVRNILLPESVSNTGAYVVAIITAPSQQF